MNILLVCAGGISTSFFVQNIRKEFVRQNISGTVIAKAITEVPEFIQNVDIVFIAPQAVFLKDKVERICDSKNIPWQIIEPTIYGQMDGAKIIAIAEELINQGG